MRETKSDDFGRNASVYQIYTVSRITGKVRAEFLRGAGVEKEGGRGEGGEMEGRGGGQINLRAETIKSPFLRGTKKLTAVEGMHQFIMYIL